MDIDSRARLTPALLRRPGVIDVVVGDDDRGDGVGCKPETREGLGDLRPVVRVAGVDQRRLAVIHQQIEVRPLRPEPEDAVRYLGGTHPAESGALPAGLRAVPMMRRAAGAQMKQGLKLTV